MIVSEPPSRAARAAPKRRFGRWTAWASMPPVRVLPPFGAMTLYALPSRVSESRSITTSVPRSTSRFARSTASSAIAVWSRSGRSNVEAITSPWTDSRKSVTSSGRSPTRTIIRWTPGWLLVTASAIALSTMVFPALGGATIRPRWPLPTGVSRSIRRVIGESVSRTRR